MTSPEVRERLEHSLGDHYRVERELGRGGMAIVFLAHDSRHDRRVALKVMHPDLALALGRERFLREIRFAAKLSHPHILPLHDSGEADGLLYYVMPYVEGESLRERLAREGRLPARDAIRIARDVADALGFAHASGVIHRDIKPENILLSSGHAVVADFGIASAVDVARDDRLTATGTSLGTPAYMSPEQALGEDIDARTDVWALGCVLFEMLAGEPPFGSEARQVISRILTGPAPSILQYRADTPRSIDVLLNRALTRDVAARIPSGTALVEAIDADDAGTKGNARMRRRLIPISIIAAAAVIALGAAGVIRSRWNATAPDAASARTSASASLDPRKLSRDSIANQLYLRGRTQLTRRTNASVTNAIDLFIRAIQRDSSFSLAWSGLSKASVFAYQRGFAIRGITRDSLLTISVNASDRALDLDSTNADNWVARARAVYYADPTVSAPALGALKRSIEIDPNYSDAWTDLAIRRQEMLDDNGAETAWLKAIALNPRNVTALGFYSIHFQWTGDYVRGVPWADSAIAVDPTYILARESAGNLALQLGRLDDAERHYQAYLRITSGREQVNGLAGLACVSAARGDVAAAREYTRRAASLSNLNDPTLHEAVLIAAATAAIGDTARAVHWLTAYQPRGDLHFQLHLKRDPGLKWLHGPWGKGILTADP